MRGVSTRVIALGTAGGVPTVSRNLPSFVVVREGESLVFDCGEGTQRQMIKAGVSPCGRMKIFITHLHGDHVIGLFGLLQTMNLLNRERGLDVYGPSGLRYLINDVLKSIAAEPSFELSIHEVGEGVVCEEKGYVVKAAWAEHSKPNLAYALIEKEGPGKFYPEKARELGVPVGPLWAKLKRGEEVVLEGGRVVSPREVLGPPRPGVKVVYSGDTAPCSSIIELARGADLLIHEATFDDSLVNKAVEDKHSTASQAAKVALEAGVKRLLLTHVSARYADPRVLKEEAAKVFPNVEVAEDLAVYEVKRAG